MRRCGRCLDEDVIVRCTKKVLDLLGRKLAADEPLGSEVEWYVNLLWIDKRKNLLMVEAETLFAIFVADVRKAEIVPFETFVVDRVREALEDEGLPAQTFGRLDPGGVTVARTASKKVLGTMNDMALHIRYAAEDYGGIQHVDVAAVTHWLRTSLHRGPDYIRPIEVARERASRRAVWN